jgi:4-alpha-glucanotransferase
MRHRGIVIPLSAVWTSRSWGIGGISDLDALAAWVHSAGMDEIMLLPVGTMPTGQTSPYSACSAMAIDPIYVDVEAMEDFQRAGGMAALGEDNRRVLAGVRTSGTVKFADVRRLKEAAVTVAWRTFVHDEWDLKTLRAGEFAGFIARERWWLDDYALFRACETMWPGVSWRERPSEIAQRESSAVHELRRQLAREVLYTQYVQWVAAAQWRVMRQQLADRGVRLFGDLPFMVDTHSADVWARQDEFLVDVSVGVPPDAFSDTGQDWGLPMYRWDVIASRGFAWIAERARRMATLYDAYRIDHLVGFYRTYGKAPDGTRFFLPADEATQHWQGEQVMARFLAPGIEVVAEDLGTVPPFVRESITRLGIGGYKVLRWERAWDQPGRPFLPPWTYPETAVATTGTHDTETMAAWWDGAPADERTAIAALLRECRLGDWAVDAAWSSELRDALLRLMATTRASHLLLPIQDVFGWRDRINTPATVGEHNWTWRLPTPVDTWSVGEPAERAAFLRALAY